MNGVVGVTSAAGALGSIDFKRIGTAASGSQPQQQLNGGERPSNAAMAKRNGSNKTHVLQLNKPQNVVKLSQISQQQRENSAMNYSELQQKLKN